jgi:hypothetical protein
MALQLVSELSDELLVLIFKQIYDQDLDDLASKECLSALTVCKRWKVGDCDMLCSGVLNQ